jgi:hypothetical protein
MFVLAGLIPATHTRLRPSAFYPRPYPLQVPQPAPPKRGFMASTRLVGMRMVAPRSLVVS